MWKVGDLIGFPTILRDETSLRILDFCGLSLHVLSVLASTEQSKGWLSNGVTNNQCLYNFNSTFGEVISPPISCQMCGPAVCND